MKKLNRRSHYSNLKVLECLKMRKMVAYPGSNTGVLKPLHEFSFDALRFTYHYHSLNDGVFEPILNSEVCDFISSLGLKVSDFKYQNIGGDFYKFRYYNEKYDIYMFYHPQRPEMGVHFKMMGNGCRLYFLDHSIAFFTVRVCRDDVSFSRIDIALDDYSGSFYSPRSLAALDSQGLISTRWNRVDPHFPRKSGGKDELLEETIYFGSLKNETHLRVYDKYLELIGQKKKTAEDFLADGISSWIRWELVLQGKSANAFIRLLFAADFDLVSTMLGVLCSKFRIIVPDASRVTRCSTDPLWIDFTSAQDAIQISRQRPESDLASCLNWFSQCMLPTYVGLAERLPDVMIQLYDHFLQIGRYRKFAS